jgi:alpha-ribazole phosphatase/probable phosphoglycerate mutase
MMSTKIYLMRHGEVVNGGEKRYNGHIDIDITARGVGQMHRLAGQLVGMPIRAVYSSDLIRSVKGAEIIAKSLGLGFTTVRELRERSVGSWEGMTAGEIELQFPEEYRAWRADLLQYRPPKGESVHDVRDRVLPAFRKLLYAHSGQEIALLLHGGVNRVILADALGLDLMHLFRIDQSFGALNIVDYFRGRGGGRAAAERVIRIKSVDFEHSLL